MNLESLGQLINVSCYKLETQLLFRLTRMAGLQTFQLCVRKGELLLMLLKVCYLQLFCSVLYIYKSILTGNFVTQDSLVFWLMKLMKGKNYFSTCLKLKMGLLFNKAIKQNLFQLQTKEQENLQPAILLKLGKNCKLLKIIPIVKFVVELVLFFPLYADQHFFHKPTG